MTKRRLLHKDSPLEHWEAEAKRLGLESGEVLREQTLLADSILEEIFREESGQVHLVSCPS